MSLKQQIELFELAQDKPPLKKLKRLKNPVWTKNKAKLIERYLYYFVLVTKHGAYIDGFAGPQEADQPEMWAAKLVLESEPRWLRKFFLYDKAEQQYTRLEELIEDQEPQKDNEPNRDIEVEHADFNEALPHLLDGGIIGEREAVFCLLDQRTFECHWSTLQSLAAYKKEPYKVELFYFFPEGWINRAIYNQQDQSVLEDWWGSSTWPEILELQGHARATHMAERFKKELGYSSAHSWPIFSKKDGGRIMYYMIHASDHPAAPNLMNRAYHQAVVTKEKPEQFLLEFAEFQGDLGRF